MGAWRSRRNSNCLASSDLDVDRGNELGGEAYPDLVRADRLDRVVHLDLATVELGTASLAGRGCDVGRADLAEQAAVGAGPARHAHAQALEPARDNLRVLETTDLPRGTRALEHDDLRLRAACPLHGDTTGDQVVAAVAGRDVYDVTGGAEPAHFLSEKIGR